MHRRGIRFRVSARPQPELARTADLVLRKTRIAVFATLSATPKPPPISRELDGRCCGSGSMRIRSRSPTKFKSQSARPSEAKRVEELLAANAVVHTARGLGGRRGGPRDRGGLVLLLGEEVDCGSDSLSCDVRASRCLGYALSHRASGGVLVFGFTDDPPSRTRPPAGCAVVTGPRVPLGCSGGPSAEGFQTASGALLAHLGDPSEPVDPLLE